MLLLPIPVTNPGRLVSYRQKERSRVQVSDCSEGGGKEQLLWAVPGDTVRSSTFHTIRQSCFGHSRNLDRGANPKRDATGSILQEVVWGCNNYPVNLARAAAKLSTLDPAGIGFHFHSQCNKQVEVA